MGYRSQVAVVIKTADNDKFAEAINDWDERYNLKGCYSVKHLIKCADVDEKSKDGEYRIISWDDIKWYSDIKGFKDVDFFEHLDDYDIEYDLIRIGEEMGDYEVNGELRSGLIWPNQDIWFDDKYI